MPYRRYNTKQDRLSYDSVEPERAMFLERMALNPNFFGTVSDSILPIVKAIQTSTIYEELGCIGYHPDQEELMATVVVKQPFGYSGGDYCGGSTEYVRFYLKNAAGDWIDQGIRSFEVNNIPDGTISHKDLDYAVRLQIDEPRRWCKVENIMEVRAILSWQVPPPADSPAWTPVWGEVQHAKIQIDKRDALVLADIPDFYDTVLPTDLLDTLDTSIPLPTKKLPTLNLNDLVELYKDTEVTPKRFLLPELQKFAMGNSNNLVLTDAVIDVIEGLQIDIDDLFSNIGDGDTSYEELRCIGLDERNSRMVGILRVKNKSGYSGGLCTAGSKEYVAFWVDRNLTNNYEFLGMGSVNVYDLQSMPGDGLYYAVSIPVNLEDYRPQCGEDVVWRVRAILSWNTMPPTTNPNWTPTWGNREEALVTLMPSPVVIPQTGHDPILKTVGGIDVNLINSSGYANGNLVDSDRVAVNAPFGGRVDIEGILANSLNINNPTTAPLRYKVRVRPFGGAWQTVDDPFSLTIITYNQLAGTQTFSTITQEVDGDGWFRYQKDLVGNVHKIPTRDTLAVWRTNGLDGHYQMMVTALLGTQTWDSQIVDIMLDNTRPTLTVVYDNECGDVVEGATMDGTFSATDLHLQHVSFVILPTDKAAGGNFTQPATSSGPSLTFPTTGESGRAWEIDTSDMVPCGYVLRVVAHDRTLVNNGSTNWRTPVDTGFCLRMSAQNEG